MLQCFCKNIRTCFAIQVCLSIPNSISKDLYIHQYQKNIKTNVSQNTASISSIVKMTRVLWCSIQYTRSSTSLSDRLVGNVKFVELIPHRFFQPRNVKFSRVAIGKAKHFSVFNHLRLSYRSHYNRGRKEFDAADSRCLVTI